MAQNGYYYKTMDTQNSDQSIEYSFKKAVMDKNGFYWISTEMGLYTYDGAKVSKVYDERFPAISKNRIVKLGLDYVSNDIYFRTYPEDCIYSIHNNSIRRIDKIQNEYKYIFSQDHKCLLPNNSTNKFVLNYLNKNFPPSDIFWANNEKFMVKKKDSLFIVIDSTLIVFDRKQKPKQYIFSNSNKIQIISANNSIFIFDFNVKRPKLFKLFKNKYSNISLKEIQIDDVIKSFFSDIIVKGQTQDIGKLINFDNKDYFFNHKNTIYKLVFKNNEVIAKKFIKNPNNIPFFLFYSQKDKTYLFKTFGKEMIMLYPQQFNSFQIDDTAFNMTYSMLNINDDNWILDSGWIYNRKDNRLTRYYPNYISKAFLLPYNNNVYYFGKDYSLYNVFTNKKLSHYKPTKNSLRSFTYLKNCLWLSDNLGLMYEVDNNFKVDKFLSKKLRGVEINNISAFNEQLVLQTTKGAFLYTPFKKLTPIKGLQNINSRYFKIIDSESFWVVTYGAGMYLVKNKKAYKVNDNNIDFDTNSIHAIECDKLGNIWISSNNGILTINKNIIIKNTLSGKSIECYRFSTDDGLLTNDYNGVSIHTSIQTKNGIIGFPSTRGFVWFDPLKLEKHCFSGNINIDKIILDNKDAAVFKNGAYSISQKTKILKFNFSYGYYYNRENLSISYRFGDQKSWTEINGNSFQIGRYKKGSQKLLIRITTNGFDHKMGITKTWVLNFESRYYEETWFWIVIAALLIALIYISYVIGKYIQKSKEIKLQSKIDEKTAQLSQNIFQLENANEQLEISKLQLSEALHEKEILLKEIHHRVKNNLQIIMSLLKIQANEGNSRSIEDFLEISESRIQSMALIHQSLYEHGNLVNIIYQDYLEQLVHHLQSAMGQQNDSITFAIEAENIFLEIETAISLGLVLNELLTNTFKYAFPNQEAGEVYISIQQLAENEFELVYSDSGIGFQEAEQTVRSFGLELVKMLVKELKGTLTKVPFRGTKYCILFRQTSVKI